MVNDSITKTKFFEIVDNYIKNKKISHAYLIEINDYENDFINVLEFVKMILCDCTRDDLAKQKSNISSLIDNNNYPDLKIIEAEGQWIKKNQLLELIDEYQNKSLLDNKRIYIIKDAEKLNSSSANTILKFLEEPEDNIVAILLTKNRFQVIETILSRCQLLTLSNSKQEKEISEKAKVLLNYIINKKELFINYNKIITEIIPDKVQAKEELEEINQVIIDYINYTSSNEKENLFKDISILEQVDVKYLINVLLNQDINKLNF